MSIKSRNIVRYIMLTAGILCVVYGALLALIGKGGEMLPFWLVLGIVLTGLSANKLFDFLFSKTWFKIMFSAGIAIAVILEIAIIAGGGRTGPWEDCDYIIVLGAHVEGEIPSQTLQYRLDAAYRYLIAYEDSKAILSGAQCRQEEISEAEAMYRYLAAKGIDRERLLLEDKSTDTYENIRNSLALLEDRQDIRICIVSSNYHILRAKMLAYKMGQQAGGYGAKTDLFLAPNSYLRELLAIIKDFVIH